MAYSVAFESPGPLDLCWLFYFIKDFPKTASFFLSPRFSGAAEEELTSHSGGGSGGYLEHVYKHAAKELFGIQVDTIQYKPLK